jgi:fumarate reductase flavoprotein subunit
MNPELSDALRLEGMIRLAVLVATGALARTESRGAHFRSDFPLRDDKQWLKRTLARWPAEAEKPQLSYEPVGLIDLPPGHRGYGKAEWIELGMPLDEYNQSVTVAQNAEGRLVTEEPMGSRMNWGSWKKVSQMTGAKK